MNKILILFAHPALQKSRIHKTLITSVKKVDNVTLHDLYEEYPEFDIDAKREHKIIENHDVLIFQFPLYWYSTPSILKQWFDIVITFGWGFGPGAVALKNKKFLLVVSSGGPKKAYQPEGSNRHTLNQLLAPLEESAHFCQMEYLPPFVIHGSLSMPEQHIRQYCEDYIRVIMGLRDDNLDLGEITKAAYFNHNFALVE